MKIKNKESKRKMLKRLFAWKRLALFVISLLIVVSMLSLKNSYAMKRMNKRIFYTTQTMIPTLAYRDATVKLNVPVHRQEHALSCEVAALKMVLNFYDIRVEESELQEKLSMADVGARDTKNNIWGDPNKGFVGSVDGTMPNSGYGVYEKPIADIALLYRSAKAFQNATLMGILQEVTQAHPVIIWGTLGNPKDISWKTNDGQIIKAVFGEHTRVVVGYSGKVTNPKEIYLIDPIYGEIKMSAAEFTKDWAHLGNRAVVVY